MSAFRKLSSIYVFSYFPFGFEGRIWDLIVSVPDHCLSFYFTGIVIAGSSNSEGDNNSVYSEISASNAWTFGKNPSNRLCAQLTRSIISTSTDISFAESMDDSG